MINLAIKSIFLAKISHLFTIQKIFDFKYAENLNKAFITVNIQLFVNLTNCKIKQIKQM